ncbi:AEL194Wp [Eremothecium gossypii ATCC 10895]|uniref:AEL194Wp n=1 Tax=Eremothecium gossypii (strain ATCC 10895 / CBS 109.51 / FGSC 9923 / NRRL Y-1056) TaxID=284811 RepID=Q758F6_EREGS|nr:AEL194Wp [Eremothecium gossypii ATCC 10895]AAS52491.1 AEL194Wp [Eremothecium gossypii ATCC 10895]AEY96791.1 FAEL194Wp [Eremothecium gossypii FDAG1]
MYSTAAAGAGPIHSVPPNQMNFPPLVSTMATQGAQQQQGVQQAQVGAGGSSLPKNMGQGQQGMGPPHMGMVSGGMPLVGQPVMPNMPPATAGISGQQASSRALDDPNVYHWICQLTYGPNKEQALLELGRKREQYDDLALVLWSSFGVMTALLQEIISIYPLLSPPMLNNQLSNRVCNALVLLQCVASHPDTKTAFFQAHIPLFLFPFLNTTSRQRTFEYLRLTSLGVIGALVKNDSVEVINFLLRTDIIPLCLRIMESSSELSTTVAIFILQKILLDDNGLQYICATQERFYAVSQVLTNMVDQLTVQQTPGRLLKHVVRCYLRLSDNLEARRLLKQVLPRQLKDNTFTDVLQDDLGTKRCLAQLLLTLNEE